MCRNDFSESLVPTPLKWRNYATKVSIKRGRSGDTTPVWNLCDEIAVFFGKQGELRERDLQDQLQRARALNILINAISIWNTVYLGKAVE